MAHEAPNSPQPKPESIPLSKAIEIVGNMIIYQYSASRSEEGEAVKLGLLAIHRIIDWREGRVLNADLLLPGETEE